MKQLNITDFINRANVTQQRYNGLVLFDYNKNVTFKFDWDNVTLNARGIVFEEATGKVIARPYKKFHNYSEIQSPEKLAILPKEFHPNFDGEFMCLEKLDGSLAIVYHYKNEWFVNTRGSFHSDQAIFAKKWLDANIDTSKMNQNVTYLFEIIYPENKIVVDYGDKEGLVLTGIIDTQTGEEWFVDELSAEATRIGVEMTEIFKFEHLEDIFKARELLGNNKEGYVITYRNGYKFKLKGEAYCNLHRSICNITPLNFWRNFDLNAKCVSIEFLKVFPEEFKFTVDKLTEITNSRFNTEYNKINTLVSTVPSFGNDANARKERFLWISNNIESEYIGCVMNILNGSESKTSEWIQRKLRPVANVIEGIDSRIYRIQNDDG